MENIVLIAIILGIILFFVWLFLPFIVSSVVSETKKTNQLLEQIHLDLQELKKKD